MTRSLCGPLIVIRSEAPFSIMAVVVITIPPGPCLTEMICATLIVLLPIWIKIGFGPMGVFVLGSFFVSSSATVSGFTCRRHNRHPCAAHSAFGHIHPDLLFVVSAGPRKSIRRSHCGR